MAFRKAGNIAKNDHVADCHSFRLDKKPGVRQRIKFLSRQEGDLIAEKRRRLEEQLWAIHEADIGDCFETVEVAKSKDGKVQTDEAGTMLTVKKQRAKLLADLPPELRKCIEDVIVDRNGNFVPRLYSRAVASKGLCALLNLGAQETRPLAAALDALQEQTNKADAP